MSKLCRSVCRLLRDDAGAITIDWVALTSGLLLLGTMVVYAVFNGGVSPVTAGINATLAGAAAGVKTGPAPDLNGGNTTAGVSEPYPLASPLR